MLIIDKEDGTCVQTANGFMFNLLSPHSDDIHLTDISDALGKICMFGGRCKEYYSAAEHAVILSDIVDEDNAIFALLHDAAVAYTGITSKTVKNKFPAVSAVEDLVNWSILKRFRLTPKLPGQVIEYAKRLRITVKYLLIKQDIYKIESVIEPLDGVNLHCWNPGEAAKQFFNRFLAVQSAYLEKQPQNRRRQIW